MERNKAGQLNVAVDLVKQIGKNLLMGSDTVRRWRLGRPRTSDANAQTDEYLKNYAFCSLDLLLEHAGDLKDKAICEIGPGDFLTSGFSMMGAGACSYCVIDRFPGDYSGSAAKEWYRQIEDNWPRFYPELPWTGAVRASDFPEGYADRVELIGEPIESARTARKYDIVCSFQVGEHISDINAFAEVHNRVMTDDGIGLHRVDFGPHDVWFAYRDPGTFLRFSDRTWSMTGSNRGVPNRKRHHEFIAAFEKAGLNVEILFLDHFDRSLMDLDRLNKKFLAMPMDSVLTGTAIYRLRKRAPSLP